MRNEDIKELAVIGRCPKNSQRQLIARIVEIGGRKCADLREFVDTAEGPKYTKRGVCIAVESFSRVVALVEKLAHAAAAAVGKESTHPGPESDFPDTEAGGDGAPAPNQESEA